MRLHSLLLWLCVVSLNSAQFRDHYEVVSSTSSNDFANCSIDACDAMAMISELHSMMRSSSPSSSGDVNEWQHFSFDAAPWLVQFSNLAESVHRIERRLRAMEQPVWRLTPATRKDWSLCNAGLCRCDADRRSFVCWNTNFEALPALQVMPLNMVTIDLSHNALSTLHKNSFRGLTQLRELDLSHNLLDFLPRELFDDLTNLMQLCLQQNQLEDFEDERIFWQLRQLRHLDISKNALKALPEKLFNQLHRLRVVNLADNKIKALPVQLLRDQRSLEELDVSRNEISLLQAGAMQQLSHLKILDFSWNCILNISDDFFADLTTLQTLLLHNNRLSSITRSVFKQLPQLLTLDLSMNRISEIDGRAFSDLSKLQNLFLDQNRLSHIPAGVFLSAGCLTCLTLFSNNIASLRTDDFQGLSSLKDLMLNNNDLKSIEAAAFTPLVSLEKLRIDANKLQFLPHAALNGLQKLLAVKLDKNLWHCDCRALYLARWLREFGAKLWPPQPLCHGPLKLDGRELSLMRYNDLCDGQWASMLSLTPRLPVRKNRIRAPMNYTEYFEVYLKHIYTTTTTTSQPQENIATDAQNYS